MRSDVIKKGTERAPHRSLMYATGLKKEDIGKPFVAAIPISFAKIEKMLMAVQLPYKINIVLWIGE